MKISTLLEKSKAILKGHFILSSGLHSDTYIQCAQVLKYPHYAELLGKKISKRINFDVDLVVSPAIGGIIIGHEVAKALKKTFVFCERNKYGKMELRRNFVIEPGQKILIVEDVVTTGRSVREVEKIVNQYGAEVVGYACIVERTRQHNIKTLISLYRIFPEIYEPSKCPLCKRGVELVKPGSRDLT